MAQKLSDAFSLEGEIPDTGEKVGLMDSVSAGKAVAILTVGVMAGYGVGRYVFNTLKSAGQSASSEGGLGGIAGGLN